MKHKIIELSGNQEIILQNALQDAYEEASCNANDELMEEIDELEGIICNADFIKIYLRKVNKIKSSNIVEINYENDEQGNYKIKISKDYFEDFKEVIQKGFGDMFDVDFVEDSFNLH